MGGDRLQGMAVETPRDASSHQFGRGRACIIGCTIPAYCVVWCAGSLKSVDLKRLFEMLLLTSFV
jgi:hypothetical protein